jgi:hypothetical protein
MNEQQERSAFEAWNRQDLLDSPVHQDPKERQFRTWQARAALAANAMHNNNLGQVDDINVVESKLAANVPTMLQGEDPRIEPVRNVVERLCGTRQSAENFARRILAAADSVATPAPSCTCPSGDGSLRWPCPEHPAPAPEADDLAQELRQNCEHWGACWRNEATHGVNLSTEQAEVLLCRALGGDMEVTITPAGQHDSRPDSLRCAGCDIDNGCPEYCKCGQPPVKAPAQAQQSRKPNWQEHDAQLEMAAAFDVSAELAKARATKAKPEAQQPKGLTNERLRQMHHEDEFGLFCDFDDFEQIARAVEQEHGIGIGASGEAS